MTRRDHTKARKPKPITSIYLERAAFHYLERFSSSSRHLARILERKVKRRVMRGTELPDEAAAWIDETVQKCVRLGLIDDRLYAVSRARNQFRKGKPIMRIRQDLYEKGVSKELINEALLPYEEKEDTDLVAAIRYAQRRRIGPFSTGKKTNIEPAKAKEKSMASMARAGFSYSVSKRVLDAGGQDRLLFIMEQAEISV